MPEHSLFFPLVTRPAMVSVARHRVAAQVASWGVSIGAEARDGLELAVSELVTNTIRHTDAVLVCVRVTLAARLLRLEVFDGSVAIPAPKPETDADKATSMAITNEHIRETVEDYLGAHPEDKVDLVPLLTLLDEDAELNSRKEFRGHATAGAVLTDDRGQVLVIHHRALSQWLLPGGHTEPEDTTLQAAALRELTEETGIPADAVKAADPRPLHVDIHIIPANTAKQEPEHRHIDFRYLFRTSADVGELQTEEVTGAEWRDIAFISDPVLRRRVSDALR